MGRLRRQQGNIVTTLPASISDQLDEPQARTRPSLLPLDNLPPHPTVYANAAKCQYLSCCLSCPLCRITGVRRSASGVPWRKPRSSWDAPRRTTAGSRQSCRRPAQNWLQLRPLPTRGEHRHVQQIQSLPYTMTGSHHSLQRAVRCQLLRPCSAVLSGVEGTQLQSFQGSVQLVWRCRCTSCKLTLSLRGCGVLCMQAVAAAVAQRVCCAGHLESAECHPEWHVKG